MEIVERLEVDLLLACARPRFDPTSNARVAEIITAGVDWTELVALALRHGVAPALLTAFAEPSSQPLVPAEIQTALTQYRDAAREQHAYLATELHAILSALADEGISALPFKGGLLAEMLYGDLGQRQPGDLDFLVQPHHVSRACDVLVARGYRDAYATAVPMTAVQHGLYRRYQCEYRFIRDHDGVVVEPHWALAASMLGIDLDYAAQFSRARRATFAGVPVSTHAPEDLLLLLCVHGAKHEWERLCWIRDVATMLERSADIGLDVDLALARAREQGCARLLLLGVEVAHRLLAAPLSTSLGDAISNDRGVGPLADDITKRLFVDDRPELTHVWVRWFPFKMHERVPNRAKYVARTLLLPRREHIEMLALPAALAWLYYPLRWGHDYVALPLWILTRPLRTHRPTSKAVQ
ncbi:MAG: nucleotidyltransferase family protein [Vicinamibacterales bacterium]